MAQEGTTTLNVDGEDIKAMQGETGYKRRPEMQEFTFALSNITKVLLQILTYGRWQAD